MTITDLVQEIRRNEHKITKLLQQARESLKPQTLVSFLNQALETATLEDSDRNIGKLILGGATNIMECIKIAKEENKFRAHAMLLLIIAAQTGNKSIVQKLFSEPAPSLDTMMDFEDNYVQEAVLSKSISTVVPIEIARRSGQSAIREELLLKTDVNEEEGYVYWHGLNLLQLDLSWLRRISWVKKLRLATNGIKALPPEIAAYLKRVYTILLCV